MSDHARHVKASGAADFDADLRTVLSAWHDATTQLEASHEALLSEARRTSQRHEVRSSDKESLETRSQTSRFAEQTAQRLQRCLAPMSHHLFQLRRRVLDDARSLRLLSDIDECLSAAEATVEGLSHYAAADRSPNHSPLALRPLIDDVLAECHATLSLRRIATRIEVSPRTVVLADYAMLRCAVWNLVQNALDAMADGGELVVISHEGRLGTELEIGDSGIGLSEDVRCHAFEPFYSTKDRRAGLGLAIVASIASAHGGEVFAANCAEGGAAFTIRLPRQVMQAAA